MGAVNFVVFNFKVVGVCVVVVSVDGSMVAPVGDMLVVPESVVVVSPAGVLEVSAAAACSGVSVP